MDQQSRDWYLARWLVSRGVCSETSITNIFHQDGDFLQNLQNASILHPQLWELFLKDMESRGSTITPPSQSNMLRAFRSESKLPKIGQQFSGYELLSELGRGGMGAVFKVRRLEDQKIFALKMILTGEDASDEHRERFRREIDAMRKLSHPNIARIYDSGSEDQTDFYTMDLIEQGRSLTKAIFDADGGLLQGVGFLSEVALALHYAHEEGVVHRDIKPSNIVVDGDKKIWIVDFGLVRDLDRVTKLTQSGAFLGTPSYMSPEQCVESSKVDARSDVYA
ncbi:MAG: serine/threonine-protein kinase, partial [Planctomycetota bacterium]|nr:serine/threonine-protein kinase [Planctomycetota bacterium]